MSDPTSSPTINTHDQLRAALAAGHPHSFAIVPAYTGAREPYFCGWEIAHPTIATDPDHRPINRKHGQKLFSTFGETGTSRAEKKQRALARAQQWVAEQYGYTGRWTRNRHGSYVPSDINRRWPIRDTRDAKTGLKVFMWSSSRYGLPQGRQTIEICAAKSKAELLRLLGSKESRLRNLHEAGNVETVKTATERPGVVFWHPIDERPVKWRADERA